MILLDELIELGKIGRRTAVAVHHHNWFVRSHICYNKGKETEEPKRHPRHTVELLPLVWRDDSNELAPEKKSGMANICDKRGERWKERQLSYSISGVAASKQVGLWPPICYLNNLFCFTLATSQRNRWRGGTAILPKERVWAGAQRVAPRLQARWANQLRWTASVTE